MKKRSFKFRSAAVVILAFTLAGCGQTSDASVSSTSITNDQPQSSVSADVPAVTVEKPEINAYEIYEKYDKDPDKRTPTYDGDQETVTGVITYIGKDDHGTDSMQLSNEKDGTSYVLGVFGSAEEMASVSVGDTVTITGNFHIMSSHDMVVLKQCKILEIYR